VTAARHLVATSARTEGFDLFMSVSDLSQPGQNLIRDARFWATDVTISAIEMGALPSSTASSSNGWFPPKAAE
jgi:hypothetical protein